MGLSANKISSRRVPANHRATSKYQFEILSQEIYENQPKHSWWSPSIHNLLEIGTFPPIVKFETQTPLPSALSRVARTVKRLSVVIHGPLSPDFENRIHRNQYRRHRISCRPSWFQFFHHFEKSQFDLVHMARSLSSNNFVDYNAGFLSESYWCRILSHKKRWSFQSYLLVWH